MKNNLRTDVPEDNFRNYLRVILKEKILIFSVSIICGFLIFFYALDKQKKNLVSITIKDPPLELFEKYNFKLDNKIINPESKNYRGRFISEFNDQLLSIDNLVSYAEQNKEINNLKEILKNKNMSLEEYFRKERLVASKEKNKIIPSKFILVLPEGVNGNFFLDNYVEFIKSISILDFKKKLKLSLEDYKNFYESAKIFSENYDLKNKLIKKDSYYEKNLFDHLFTLDREVLSSQIFILDELIKKLNSDEFNYNHILEKSYAHSLFSRDFLYLSFLAGLIFGFFLSLVIIFVKNTFKEK